MEDNTQFENDFETVTDEAAAAANPANEEVVAGELTAEEPTVLGDVVDLGEAPAAEDQGNGEDDFFAENAAPEIPQVDPAKIITLIPSSADNKYVETDGNPVPMLDLLSRAQLRFEGNFTCYLNNAEIALTTLVPAGSTVSIVGKVKGGC